MTITTTGIAGTIIPALDSTVVAGLLDSGHKKASSPLQVRYRQGVKEVLEMISERIGISMSELTCILVEDALRGMILPLSTAAGSVVCRVEQLIQAHSLTPPELAQLLSPWNIRLSVLQDPVKMIDYLSPQLLNNFAKWFHINPDWLSGSVNTPVVLSGCWPETQEALHALMLDSNNAEVIIWHCELPAGEYHGILLRQRISVNSVTIYPVLSLPPVNSTDDRSLWINHIPESLYTVPVRKVSLKPWQADLIINGRIFPAVLFNTQLQTW
ncbi:conjugal transfer protein TraE [Salmonella enterica subsp. enterica serovar Muenchen]|uniref:conjugal transfer protein TraE n=1 Tax=Salmonella enterica TaxID=28901 RepID=UPI001F0FD4DA|nr:conjugal transfer protein TraE [Salmonella enterica]EAW2474128.1 conjugal transfer protein TraE [Salmonella enterica subsp. enterica]EEJ6214436.1 conjugal transfer protein TraE [Salmonella enterica]MCH5443958.1 conjugal transfer protein TraE [Salmonella enterica subsp. enterica serovar Muenchen]